MGVAEGGCNSNLPSLVDRLLRHGVDPDVALGLMLCWNRARCHSPLSDDEVASFVQSMNRLHVLERARRQRR